MLIQDWPADYHALDSRYKIGADLDYVLSYNFGVRNLQTAALGAGPEDDYRIVTNDEPARGYHRFNLPLTDFSKAFQAGNYSVYIRDAPSPGEKS